MVTCLPVSRSYCVFMSSRAFFKLAAANTTTSRGCASAREIGRSHALAPSLAIAPSSHRRRPEIDIVTLPFPQSTDIFHRIDRPLRLGEWFCAMEILMKLSARNQLKGKIVAVTKGQTTAHVRIDIGGGVIVTSSITNEAVDDLALKVGDDALAVIKASDVMVGK